VQYRKPVPKLIRIHTEFERETERWGSWVETLIALLPKRELFIDIKKLTEFHCTCTHSICKGQQKYTRNANCQ
jgi:hypothetical protein